MTLFAQLMIGGYVLVVVGLFLTGSIYTLLK